MKHYNPTISQNLSRIFNTKGESTSDVTDEIVPTVEVFTPGNYLTGATLTDATSASAATSATDKDTYITWCTLAWMKDASATTVYVQTDVTINGVVKTLIKYPLVSLTAGSGSIGMNFNPPIKIDRGTTPHVTASTATAKIVATMSIGGYEVDTVKGV